MNDPLNIIFMAMVCITLVIGILIWILEVSKKELEKSSIPYPHSVPETPPAPEPKRASGYWSSVPFKPMKGMQDAYTYCSVCGRPEKAWDKERKFCSYCGARLKR